MKIAKGLRKIMFIGRQRNEMGSLKPLLGIALLVAFLFLSLLTFIIYSIRVASTSKSSEGILYEGGAKLEGQASDFSLMDHNGATIALSDFRGKAVILAFLDPRCTDECPLTAFHFRLTSEALGKDSEKVAFLAINANIKFNSISDMVDATDRWGLNNVRNWHFLSANSEELKRIASAYKVSAGDEKPGKPEEVLHIRGVFLIDHLGNQRRYISPPPDSKFSLSDLLVKHIRILLKESEGRVYYKEPHRNELKQAIFSHKPGVFPN